MTFDELFNSLPAVGWLHRDEALLLLATAHGNVGDILEIGCFHGRSTVLLASTGRQVHCVDPFEGFLETSELDAGAYASFNANIAERGIANTTLYRERIEDWSYKPMGFAYLDGDHTYEGTKRQIHVALRCGVKEMCLHDYNEDGGGIHIKRAVDECHKITVIDRAQRVVRCKVK